jgi:lipopolysaccharide transport system permease protein
MQRLPWRIHPETTDPIQTVSKPVVIYSAESRARELPAVVRDMVSGLRHGHYTAYRLALKDVKGDYAKSVFGLLWDLADPLVFGAIFYFLMVADIIKPGNLDIPYPLFVTYGMLLYLTFTEAWLSSLRLFQTSRSLLAQVKIPPEALILSVLYRVAFNSSFRVLVMALFSVAMGAFSPLGFAKFVTCYPLLILGGMALGLFLAPFNAVYNDVERIVRLIILPLRFASPVFFVIGSASLIAINPVAVLITNLRDVATTNEFHSLAALAGWSGALGMLLLVGWLVFHLSVPVLAERA